MKCIYSYIGKHTAYLYMQMYAYIHTHCAIVTEQKYCPSCSLHGLFVKLLTAGMALV